EQAAEAVGDPGLDRRRSLEQQHRAVPRARFERSQPEVVGGLAHGTAELGAKVAPRRGQLEMRGQLQAAPSKRESGVHWGGLDAGASERANISAERWLEPGLRDAWRKARGIRGTDRGRVRLWRSSGAGPAGRASGREPPSAVRGRAYT